MGSGKRSPVGKAQTVETEAHQDVFEVRFDHLAFGGTSIILIAAAVALCWHCRRKNKKKRQRNRGQSCQSSRESCRCRSVDAPIATPTLPAWPPMMPPSWYPMSMMPMTDRWSHHQPPPAPSRFTELPPDHEPTNASQPPRPPPPRARELPSPSRPATKEDI